MELFEWQDRRIIPPTALFTEVTLSQNKSYLIDNETKCFGRYLMFDNETFEKFCWKFCRDFHTVDDLNDSQCRIMFCLLAIVCAGVGNYSGSGESGQC